MGFLDAGNNNSMVFLDAFSSHSMDMCDAQGMTS